MRISICILLILLIFCYACEKKGDEANSGTLIKSDINGYVQKGPFISGTSITISELKGNLSQTGKVYTAQIVDNKGSFMVNDLELASNYVSLRADGFYYNEILGEQSSAQITLYAISDISVRNTVNVNILSHLEKSRIEYLVDSGISFNEAKRQAQAEVLAIFNFKKDDIEVSEDLDIAEEGEDNAILLAASLILQGYRTEAELTELLSNISTDIREDGILNSSSTGSKLINHAVSLDTLSIRENLSNRYEELGVSAVIPPFGKYIKYFIDSTDFEISGSLIDYPETGNYGPNILDLEKTEYDGENFSLAVNLGKGVTLKIKISALGSGGWFYSLGSVNNWTITTYDFSTNTQYFTAIESDRSCDLKMMFEQGTFRIDYYENNMSTPTRTKIITYEDSPPTPSCFEPDHNDSTIYELQNHWNYLGYRNYSNGADSCLPEELSGIDIEFNTDFTFQANSSCNIFNGNYSIGEPDTIRISNLTTTLIECVDSLVINWEDIYFQELSKAQLFYINHDILRIETESYNALMFRAVKD